MNFFLICSSLFCAVAKGSIKLAVAYYDETVFLNGWFQQWPQEINQKTDTITVLSHDPNTMCSVSLMPVFNHLCKVRCWMLNKVYLTVYLSFQVLCLLLNSLLLILKMSLKDYVQNLKESEWRVSETCVLASLNRAKEIWKVMQGNGCTSILGFF